MQLFQSCMHRGFIFRIGNSKPLRRIRNDFELAEAAFDDAVVAAMNDGLSIQDALTRAGKEYPQEALTVTDVDLPDLGARYEYLREHARLMGVVKKRRLR